MTFSALVEETIAAVVTAVAPGQGGVAIVRISGSLAEKVVRKVVSVPGKQVWASHHVLYGYVVDETSEERIDEVLLVLMKSPRSFTGEDVVEIHCHGGLILVQRVLDLVLAQPGVRRALPGEFSQRAVLNGRIDLTRAEAVNDLISARSKRAAQLAMAGLDGGIEERISLLRQRLLDQLSELDARVDFEDELPYLNTSDVLNELESVRSSLLKLVEDYRRSLIYRNGLCVALIGRPNVGKSSLLNLLSGRQRAIVTDLPGTTRDILESAIILGDVPITLIDTAGIHATENSIERIGIDRSFEVLKGADVVLLVFDLENGWTKADAELLNQIPSEIPRLLIGNKADLQKTSMKKAITSKDQEVSHPDVCISALTGEGEQNLIKAVIKAVDATEGEGCVVALNERQVDLALVAVKALERVSEVGEQKLPWDFWTIDLRHAIRSLGEITGEDVTEAVLDRIFSRFCIGK